MLSLFEQQEAAPQSKTYIEERPFWGEFFGAEVDGDGKYKKPTPEQKERFKKSVERVSEIFENAHFQWYLDGATNISLYGDEQLRDHKDLDISVFQEDLAKLEELLSEQGFDLFVSYIENGRKLMRRVTVEELEMLKKPDLSICKISPDGKIERETKEPFNFVDLHVHSKDAEGDIVISYNGMTLPKEFFEPVRKELSNGKKINLSHPAVVAYHKLHSDRCYDLIDLQKLRPNLQKRDFQILRVSLRKEIETVEKMVREKLGEVWDSLRLIPELIHDQEIISGKFWEFPEFKERRNERNIFEFVSSISRYISENPNSTFEDFFNRSMNILKPQEKINQKLEVIDQLERVEGDH